MSQEKKKPIPQDEPGGRLAGPPPGVYSSDDEYLDDMLKGLPKLKAAIAKNKEEKKVS